MGNKSGIAALASGRVDVHRLDPRIIRVKPGFNARDLETPENAAHVEALALSIAEHGVLTPLRVYLEDGDVYLSDGHCRLAATLRAIAEGAEILSVPVMAENRYASEADKTLIQITANSGKRLTPLETAKVFRRLLDYGWPESQIAQRAGVSRTYVVQLLELQAAPADVVEMVAKGEVSATLASSTPHNELRRSVAKARAEGKKKVTKKDVGLTPAKRLARVTELLEALLADPDRHEEIRRLYGEMQ